MNSETGDMFDVLVLGGGYAGLMAALRVKGRAGRSLSVGLVNPSTQFVERIRLQDTLAPSTKLDPVSIANLLQSRAISFLQGRVRSIDTERCIIEIQQSDGVVEVCYGRIVHALGSQTERSSVPGVEEHTHCLDSESATDTIKRKLAHRESGKIVVVGGGALGIEVAAELKASYPRFDIELISRSHIGHFQTPKVESLLRSGLSAAGVVLRDDTRVTLVSAGELTVANKGAAERKVAYDFCIWCAGMATPPITGLPSERTSPDGRLMVDAYMRISKSIWVAGDAAKPSHFTGAPYRMSAMAAMASGAYCADSIVKTLKRRRIKPFSFSTWGQGIALGRGGVGFLSYPNDRQRFVVFSGKTARVIRDVFVRMLLRFLTLEARITGAFYWLGKGRAIRQTNTPA